MEAKNIVITHGYSDSNKGDLAITQATVDGLREKFPHAKITLMSTFRSSDPDFWYHNRKMKENDIEIIEGILPTPYIGGNTSFITNVIAVLRLFLNYIQLKISFFGILGRYAGGKQFQAYTSIKNADLVIVKGGQFIYNDKEDLRGNLFLWRTLQPIRVASQLKKKVIILGQSIGGFASEKSEKYAMKYISLCSHIVVREELSYNLLRKYHIPNVSLAPDTAFYIKKKDINVDLALSEGREILGITVVNWTFPRIEDPVKAKERYIENLVGAIELSYKKYNLFPLFIPQVTVRHHGKSDLDLIYVIQQKLNEKGIQNLVLTEDYNANEMVGVYSKCKLLVGTRLHSCILAANAGTPVIAIRYQGFKTQGVMKMIGFERFVHDISSLKKDDLFSDIDDFMANYTDLKVIIKQSTNDQINKLKRMFFEIGN
ncbi:polysaccharide pyruvyl transferase family protein [Galbibacter sp.]|uniref:polysaccharide pyruvyl transferase family protein n=1 Tax=Galbibacter sp. TaxID=2918471 RepID=UPI003A9461CF